MQKCRHPSIRIHAYISIHNTYTQTYIHTCMHTDMHTHKHTHTYAYMYVHAYIHTCMHTCIHAYMHTYIHVCIHAYMCTHKHTYTHAYMHTYMHTCNHLGVAHGSVCITACRHRILCHKPCQAASGCISCQNLRFMDEWAAGGMEVDPPTGRQKQVSRGCEDHCRQKCAGQKSQLARAAAGNHHHRAGRRRGAAFWGLES